jgi:hypothetical protein
MTLLAEDQASGPRLLERLRELDSCVVSDAQAAPDQDR